jgi:hypothetical protein
MMSALPDAPRFRKFLPFRLGSKFKISPTLRLLFPDQRPRACFARVSTLSGFQEAVCDFSHKGIGVVLLQAPRLF